MENEEIEKMIIFPIIPDSHNDINYYDLSRYFKDRIEKQAKGKFLNEDLLIEEPFDFRTNSSIRDSINENAVAGMVRLFFKNENLDDFIDLDIATRKKIALDESKEIERQKWLDQKYDFSKRKIADADGCIVFRPFDKMDRNDATAIELRREIEFAKKHNIPLVEIRLSDLQISSNNIRRNDIFNSNDSDRDKIIYYDPAKRDFKKASNE